MLDPVPSNIPWTDPFASSHNLSSLWPHDDHEDMIRRVEQGGIASYDLIKRPLQMWYLVAHMEDYGNSTLGSFPSSLRTVLSILLRKWNCYHTLFLTLQGTQTSPDPPGDPLWVHALLDSWGRNCLYMERILEVAIQWSRAPNQSEQCIVLRLFALQEYNSTHHQPAVSSVYNFLDVDGTIFTNRELFPACVCINTKQYACTALKWWGELHDGSLIWIDSKAISENAALLHVHAVLEQGQPESIAVSRSNRIPVSLTKLCGTGL